MIFYAELGLKVDVVQVDDMATRVEEFLDALADLEEADPSIHDVDVTAALATGDVSATMYVRADDLADAGQKIVATVRAALHEIGDGTPGWEHVAQAMRQACMNVRAEGARELAGT
ncbi:hypothetical protein [Actinomadura flavalba]|uniref:hypothetical protein n=1 Tax=Actinomadura flavalba TaxID=1120938 RepID=UPI000363423D|nr:hypothetical protein [Actinomadura flavalba]